MFKYKTVNYSTTGFFSPKFDESDFEKFLNKFAKDGWEVVSSAPINEAYGQTKSLVIILKKVTEN